MMSLQELLLSVRAVRPPLKKSVFIPNDVFTRILVCISCIFCSKKTTLQEIFSATASSFVCPSMKNSVFSPNDVFTRTLLVCNSGPSSSEEDSLLPAVSLQEFFLPISTACPALKKNDFRRILLVCNSFLLCMSFYEEAFPYSE